MRFVGDVHGKIKDYLYVVRDCKESVQIGDFGIGFVPYPEHHHVIQTGNHRFIRGNHDDPELCKNTKNFIKDGYFDEEKSIMYIGGAASIDRYLRKPFIDWWPDEEVSYVELGNLSHKYSIEKPKIMITHECPDIIATLMCNELSWTKYPDRNRTRIAFEQMFEEHKPELWIFGHWHLNWDKNILGTRFICLDELAYIDIDFDDLSKGFIE